MKRRTKTTITYGIIAFIGIILIVTMSWFFLMNKHFKEYKNKKAGVSIKYSPDWILNENVIGTIAVFLSPVSSDADDSRESVNIVIQDLSRKPMALQEYTALAIKQMEAVFKENFVVIDSSPTSLDGHTAHRLEFLGKGPQGDLHYLIVWTVAGTKAYQVTYTSIASQYNRQLGTVKAMLKSFKIL